jgi:hypothetical protein
MEDEQVKKAYLGVRKIKKEGLIFCGREIRRKSSFLFE